MLNSWFRDVISKLDLLNKVTLEGYGYWSPWVVFLIVWIGLKINLIKLLKFPNCDMLKFAFIKQPEQYQNQFLHQVRFCIVFGSYFAYIFSHSQILFFDLKNIFSFYTLPNSDPERISVEENYPLMNQLRLITNHGALNRN